MPTADFPNLDASLLLFDKHIPTTIARAADVLAATARGGANGVAPLDASAFLPVANVAPGAIIAVLWNGVAWPASRPTNRTDVRVEAFAPAGTASPTWLLATDSFETWSS